MQIEWGITGTTRYGIIENIKYLIGYLFDELVSVNTANRGRVDKRKKTLDKAGLPAYNADSGDGLAAVAGRFERFGRKMLVRNELAAQGVVFPNL